MQFYTAYILDYIYGSVSWQMYQLVIIKKILYIVIFSTWTEKTTQPFLRKINKINAYQELNNWKLSSNKSLMHKQMYYSNEEQLVTISNIDWLHELINSYLSYLEN